MEILILGGTGAMGTHLVDILSKNLNNSIFVTSRSEIYSSKVNVKYIQGNAKDIDFFNQILTKKFDIIVDFMVYSTIEFKVRLEKFLSACEQYIFLSSSRVFAESQDLLSEESNRLLDEINDVNYLKTDEYALSKARQEDLLRSSSKRNWTIVRPYITFSEKRFQFANQEKEDWMYRVLHNKEIVISESILNKYTTITSGDDVASSICVLVNNKYSYGKEFNISSSEFYTWREILILYQTLFKKYLNIDMKIKICSDTEYNDIFNNYQVKYDRLFNRRFDNTKIMNFMEDFEFSNLKESLEIAFSSFIENQQMKEINWATQAKMDRITGEFTHLNKIKDTKSKFRYLKYRYM